MSQLRILKGYDHSSHKALVRGGGSLVFEVCLYGDDFMDEYATKIYVLGEDATRARADMVAWSQTPLTTEGDLANAIEKRFGDVSDARKWLDLAGIPYTEVYDPWARGNVPEY